MKLSRSLWTSIRSTKTVIKMEKKIQKSRDKVQLKRIKIQMQARKILYLRKILLQKRERKRKRILYTLHHSTRKKNFKSSKLTDERMKRKKEKL